MTMTQIWGVVLGFVLVGVPLLTLAGVVYLAVLFTRKGAAPTPEGENDDA